MATVALERRSLTGNLPLNEPGEYAHPAPFIPEHNKERRWRTQDLKFAQLFDDFNPQLMDKSIHRGTENRVYEYGNDKVIKIPRFLPGISKNTARMAETSLGMFQRYLPEYIVHSEVLGSPKTPYCLIVQDKLDRMEYINARNYERFEDDLRKIAEINKRLIKEEGLSVDFVGRGSLRRLFSKKNMELTNFAVVTNPDGTESLKIIDNGFIKLGKRRYEKVTPGTLLSRLRNVLVFAIQRKVMKDNFGISIS